MWTIFFTSLLVSIVTLLIHLFRPNKSIRLDIPSWFLAAEASSKRFKLEWQKPPFWIWLAILVVTAGFAGVYFPNPIRLPASAQSKPILVLFDNSYSHWRWYENADIKFKEISQDLFSKGFEIFLIQPEILWSSEKNFKNVVQLVPQSTPELFESSLEQLWSKGPSALSTDIQSEALLDALERAGEGPQKEWELYLITDGGQETITQLGFLRKQFSKVHVFQTPAVAPLTYSETSIVPQSFYKIWQNATLNSAENPGNKEELNERPQPGGIYASPWMTYIRDKDSVSIPDLALPNVSLGEWKSKSTEKSIYYPVQTSKQVMNQSTISNVLFFFCSFPATGPQEYNPMGEIQSFARFFGSYLQYVSCPTMESEEQSHVSKPPGALDQWWFRGGGLWVAPLQQEIKNALWLQGKLWYPKGFEANRDTLAYVGPTFGQVDLGEGFVVPTILKLDQTQPLQSLGLIESPPLTSLQSTPTKSGVFKPVFSSLNEIPLVYQFGSDPIYFHRLPATMPSGDLSRSARWVRHWLDTFKSPNQSRAHVHVISKASPEALWESNQGASSEGFSIYRSLLSSRFPLKLNGKSLEFKEVENVDGFHFTPGLYQFDPVSPDLFLVTWPTQETQSTLLSLSQILDILETPSTGTSSYQNAAQKEELSWWVPPSCAAALIGLLCLWAWQSGLGRSRQSAAVLLIGSLGLSSLGKSHLAEAQGGFFGKFRQKPTASQWKGPRTTSFQIAWCDQKLTEADKERYAFLRDTVANRGTIEMPESLMEGGCIPGKAQVWWATSAAALRPTDVQEHVSTGGFFLIEGQNSSKFPENLQTVEASPMGLLWQPIDLKGMLVRSFYLIPNFDGCPVDGTKILMFQKKSNAKSLAGLVTSAQFMGTQSDCFGGNDDYRIRSFVNLMYSVLTTDYKEDQLKLPEILKRVRNLGLEP